MYKDVGRCVQLQNLDYVSPNLLLRSRWAQTDQLMAFTLQQHLIRKRVFYHLRPNIGLVSVFRSLSTQAVISGSQNVFTKFTVTDAPRNNKNPLGMLVEISDLAIEVWRARVSGPALAEEGDKCGCLICIS